jgi:hypothetical protein
MKRYVKNLKAYEIAFLNSNLVPTYKQYIHQFSKA